MHSYSAAVIDMMMDEAGSRSDFEVTSQTERSVQRTQWDWQESLEISEPTPSDTPPPSKPHLRILPKQFHH